MDKKEKIIANHKKLLSGLTFHSKKVLTITNKVTKSKNNFLFEFESAKPPKIGPSIATLIAAAAVMKPQYAEPFSGEITDTK